MGVNTPVDNFDAVIATHGVAWSQRFRVVVR
jgi:hypothetical protein